MIVHTSALVAVARREEGYGALLDALLAEPGAIPAPALLEFRRVTSGPGNLPDPAVDDLLAELAAAGSVVVPFDAEHARIAAEADARFGKGNGRGGALNILNLMVYAVATASGRPILCTGRDFASTDAAVHAASRGW